MKMKKSLLCMLLAVSVLVLCMPVSANALCKKKKKADDATLTVQCEGDWMEYYEAAAERVKEEYPDAEIELIEVGSFDHLDTIDNTDAGNPDVADLFALPADRLYGLYEADALGAVDSEAIAEKVGGWEDFDAFNEGLGGNFKIEDEYFAFPFNIETLINFVNTANAEEKDIDLEEPFELTELEDPELVLLPLFDCWFGVAAVNSADIELLGKDEDGELFSDMTEDFEDLPEEKQDFFKALYEYWKLNFDENTSLFDADAGWGYIDDCFTSGEGGVIRLGGPWETNANVEKTNDGEDLAVYPIGKITINELPLRHWKGGWGLAINSRIETDADKVELAEAMIAEIVNPEYAVELFEATGKILENVEADVYKDSELEDVDKDVIEAVIESYADAPARPLFTEWGKVWDTWKNAILSWNSVEPEDAETAYNELKASFEAMMENFDLDD